MVQPCSPAQGVTWGSGASSAGPVEAPWRSRRASREALPGPGGRCGNVRCDGLCVARGGLQGSGDVLGGVLGFYWKTLKFGAIQHSERCYSFT